jgi:hypothetical protein
VGGIRTNRQAREAFESIISLQNIGNRRRGMMREVTLQSPSKGVRLEDNSSNHVKREIRGVTDGKAARACSGIYTDMHSHSIECELWRYSQ